MKNLFKNDFIKLTTAREISLFGSTLSGLLSMFWIYDLTSSITQTIWFQVSGYIWGTILTLVFATVADNYDKKRPVLIAELGMFAVFLIYGVLAFYKIKLLWLIYLLQFFAAIFNAVLSTFLSTWMMSILKDNYHRPWARYQAIRSFNQFLFLSIAGVLSGLLSFWVVFIIDAFTYLLAFVIELQIVSTEKISIKIKELFSMSYIINDYKKCYYFIKNEHQYLFIICCLCMLFNFLSVPLGDMLPFYVKDIFKETPTFYSFLLMAGTAGGLVAVLLLQNETKYNHFSIKMICFVMLIEGLLAIVFSALNNNNKWYAIPILFFVFLTVTIFNISTRLLLRSAGVKYFAKLTSFIDTLSSLFIPLGLLFSTYLSQQSNLQGVYLYNGLGLIILFILTTSTLILTKTIRFYTRKELA
ncbi:MAG: MFS transporter [Oligoflexia bacterium]|nr:MFS transporter [Oligoflexia bacterium]